MDKKAKGWEYLHSDTEESSYFEEDGNWGYKNSDGSGSYYGADGSWGYKNSDGSSSYYGADGSWGYKNSDGSGYYYGGSSGQDEFFSATEDEHEDDTSTDSSLLADLLVGAIGLAIGAGVANRLQRGEKERREEEEREAEAERIRRKKEQERRAKEEVRKIEKDARRIKKEKRRRKNALKRKRRRAFIFKRKKIKIQHSADELIGKSISSVYSILFEEAFTNITAIPVKDIYVDSPYAPGEVTQISISGFSFFREGDLIPYDAKIVITYHEKREFVIPFSSRTLKKMGKTGAGDALLGLGFTEIYAKPIRNLITGWLRKDGSIKRLTVGGSPKFKKRSVFAYDTEIIIEYYTFKKGKKRKQKE